MFLEVAAVAELHLTDVAREPSTFVVRLEQMSVELVGGSVASSGGATPGRATSNDLAGRSTALPIALLLFCIAAVLHYKLCRLCHLLFCLFFFLSWIVL